MIGSTRIDDLERAVLRLNLEVQANTMNVEKLMSAVHTEPPEPQPDLEATIRSLHESNEGLRNLLADAKQTERDLDAEVARLTKENQRLTQLAWEAQAQVDKLKQHNDDLARDAGALIGARALNEALTQKQHMLEAKNRDLEERLERHRDCIDRTADALELLGFQVFAPGTDVCDND
jgi:chromosome segregation ATPase